MVLEAIVEACGNLRRCSRGREWGLRGRSSLLWFFCVCGEGTLGMEVEEGGRGFQDLYYKDVYVWEKSWYGGRWECGWMDG